MHGSPGLELLRGDIVSGRRHAIKSKASTLDLLAGLNYTNESYSRFSRNFPAATLGEEFTHKLRSTTLLLQKLYFYPGLTTLDSTGQLSISGRLPRSASG